jgi:Ca-activated chloride channel family protein
MSSDQLTLSADCDRQLVAVEVSSQRTIEWTIIAPKLERPSGRAPLNLALVLDRSGSMRGDKLRYVQRAAHHVLDLLDERDRVALIAYDDQVKLLATSEPVTDRLRDELKARIDALRPGGQTDLGGGWLKGCQEVADHQALDGVNRVLLLTDGLANRGITDLEELARHARELRRRGVSTSTFGVGLDFNEQLLEAMAEEGGGHFRFIEQTEQIPDVFRRELGELLTIVAREAFLRIAVPKGLTVELLGDLLHERDGDALRVFMGDLSAGERRSIYTKVLLPPDAPGAHTVLRAEVAYADLDGRTVTVSAEQWFSYARQAEVLLTPLREAILNRAGEVEMAAATARALKLERRGARQEAQALLVHSLAAHTPYLQASAAASYNALADNIGQGLTEEQRKQTHFKALLTRKSRSDM